MKKSYDSIVDDLIITLKTSDPMCRLPGTHVLEGRPDDRSLNYITLITALIYATEGNRTIDVSPYYMGLLVEFGLPKELHFAAGVVKFKYAPPTTGLLHNNTNSR